MDDFFPNPASLQEKDSFEVVKNLKDKGLLQVVLFTGPPRCGTTATGKFGHQATQAHVNINQPGMFSRAGHMEEKPGSETPHFVLSPRDRKAGIWRRVYEQVFRCYMHAKEQGVSPDQDNPILLSAKETTHLIMFETEAAQWRSLAEDRVVMSIRNPVQQMRSALFMILDNIDTDIFADCVALDDGTSFTQDAVDNPGFHVSRHADARTFSVHGQYLLNAEKLQALLDNGTLSEDENGNLAWPDVYRHIRSQSDFGILNDKALQRFALYNPFLEEPEVQAEIWRAALDSETAEPAINDYGGTRLEDFHTLPDCLCDALFRWRMGWLPTRLHLERNTFPGLMVSDFTCMQMQPDPAWDNIISAMKSRGLITGQKSSLPHLDYDICTDPALPMPWDAWFLEQDYSTVLKEKELTRPRHAPMSADRLPDCVRKLLPEAMAAYIFAITGGHALISNMEEIKNFDPVTHLAHALASQNQDETEKNTLEEIKTLIEQAPESDARTKALSAL